MVNAVYCLLLGQASRELSPAYIRWITNNLQSSYRDIKMITQERLKELLHYDQLTGDFTWLVSSGRRKAGAVAGWVSTGNGGKKYLKITIAGKKLYAHRLAFLYVSGELPRNEVDHVNGNGLDNKWVNMRNANHIENHKNRRLNSNNSSGFTGVSWRKDRNKWCSRIKINGKYKFLGSFECVAEAIYERQAANIKYGFHENHGTERPL